MVGRIRSGRPTAVQWLALADFCAWLGAAAAKIAWPVLAQMGAATDQRRQATNLLNVAVILVMSLAAATFGIRERLRPVFVIVAIVAGLLVWWLPGHGAAVLLREHIAWMVWLGMCLYLGCIAAVTGRLLAVGRSRHRTGLPLSKLTIRRVSLIAESQEEFRLMRQAIVRWMARYIVIRAWNNYTEATTSIYSSPCERPANQ